MTYLRNKMGWILAGAGLSAAATIAFGQPDAQSMGAREVFYKPLPAAGETTKANPGQGGPKPAAAKGAEGPKPQATGQQGRSGSAASATATPDPQRRSDPGAGGATVSATAPDPKVGPGRASDSLPILPVDNPTRPLGIRLSIVKDSPSGPFAEDPPEVSLDTNFHKDDRVRLHIKVNDKGYLYILDRQSSGIWKPLLPSPDLPGISNVVEPGTVYSVPPTTGFLVGDPPGEEKLFIVLSRTPEDLQSLIMDMSRREGGSSTPKSPANEPPSQPPTRQPSLVTVSQNSPPLNDGMVDQMRSFYARDLLIEKMDDQMPGPSKENAVYAATNPNGGNDKLVVLDAQINHR